jgi:hypothetical protein
MAPPQRLYFHIGLQKTGTSYLQDAMLRNKDDLGTQGLDLVPPTKRESYELILVVRDRYRSRRDPASDSHVLSRFSSQLAQASGSSAIFSQESLAAATPQQIQLILEVCRDREVHVIATVRDLARQLPSSWQQELKAGGTVGYRPYLRRLQATEQADKSSRHWIHLDPPTVLTRWSQALSPERIHVVTVPPPGNSPTALLERFCRVLEVDPARIAPEERALNTSLGRAQAEVLRRVNSQLPEAMHRREVYGDVVKRFFAARVLGAQEPHRILVPTRFRDWCEQVADRQIAALSAAGYQVEGSLDDLRCLDAAFSDHERPPREREVAAAAVSALADILSLRGSGARRPDGDPPSPGITARLLGLAPWSKRS